MLSFPQSSDEEAARLRGCLNALVSLMALPAVWRTGEPEQIVTTLLDALIGTLGLACICARLTDPDGRTSLEVVRTATQWRGVATPEDFRDVLEVPSEAQQSRPSADLHIGGSAFRLAFARLGLEGDLGTIVAASPRLDFPTETEALLVDVAANQAALRLQQARLLSAQQQIATVLDERVARRTSELALANHRLEVEVAERRRAEQALRESESNSRVIVDSVPALVVVMSASGEVEHVNRQVLEYFGQTLEEMKDWRSNDNVHPDDRQHVIDTLAHALATGALFKVEHRLRRRDGQYLWFQARGLPFSRSGGPIGGWCMLLTDIEDRKHAEQGLLASEGNLRKIINTLPVTAWSTRPDGFCDFLNQRWLEYAGFTAAEAAGWGWGSVIHPDDAPGLVTYWQGCLASGTAVDTEARMRRADGVYRWFLFRANPLRDEQGTIIKWYGTNIDIEDRKRADEALRRSETFLAAAQRISATGSFSWRLDSDEMTFSEELHRIFELDAPAAASLERIATRVHPDDLPLLSEWIDQIREGRATRETEMRLRMADGRVKFIRTFVNEVHHLDSRRECLGAVQDVTERRLSYEALDKARSELAHVTRSMSLGALAASIAHEVNQPLTGIITNAGTCVRLLTTDPPNVEAALDTARRTIRDGHRASNVVVRLRALFGRRDVATETVDLNEAAREVISLLSSDLQRSRVVVQADLEEESLLVSGDRVQLQQVIMNLMRNASDAMSGIEARARQLRIRTQREDGEHVRLTVQDVGIGLDLEEVDRMFDPFYSTKSDGMGIGLSVSRSIIERHAGRLWAVPNDGPGATVAFSIPCRSVQPAVAAEHERAIHTIVQ